MLNNRAMSGKKGVALVMVLLIATIVLTVTTTMLYLLNQSSRYSGLSKRYANSLEAAMASPAIITDFINVRTNAFQYNKFTEALDSIGFSNVLSNQCSNDKFNKHTVHWDGSCKKEILIDPADSVTYDQSFNLGSYEVFTKIVHTIPGNTSATASSDLSNPCVVHCEDVITHAVIPTSYIIEVLSVRRGGASNKKLESAKVSILYQF